MNKIKIYNELNNIPIYIKISPLRIHKILITNPFFETDCFKFHNYALKLIIKNIFPNNTFYIEIKILNRDVKLKMIINFILKCIYNYLEEDICIDNIIKIIETETEVEVSVNNQLLLKQKYF